MKRPNEKIQYGITVAEETIKYGAVGYLIKLLYNIKCTLGYNLYVAGGKTVNTLEENITDPLIENTGPIGRGMYEAEKWHGRFWSKILGQTEEKQSERREKYLEKKSNYQGNSVQGSEKQTDQNSLSQRIIGTTTRFGVKLDEKADKPIVRYFDNVGNAVIGYEKPEDKTQTIVSQPSQSPIYHQNRNYINTGDFILAASIFIGAVMGHFKAKKEYQKSKRKKEENKDDSKKL